MKITKVDVLPVGYKLKEQLKWGSMEVSIKGGVLVRIYTDEGVSGLGEAGFSCTFYPIIAPIVKNMLEPLLIGKDPRFVEKIWEEMFQSTHMWGRRGFETYALSGVDIALWDILGKVSNQPIYRLLGGFKTSVRAYSAPDLKEPERIIKECENAMRKGFAAIKLRVGLGVKKDLEIVQNARKVVGNEIDLIVDANMAYDFRTALKMSREFEQYNILWLEEPILSRSLEEYCSEHSRLKEKSNVPIAGGECLFTRYEFIPIFTRRVFDIVQPDCTGVGGITEANKIAGMASAHGVICIPHIACSSGTGVGFAANLHIICSSGRSPLIEYDPYESLFRRELLKNPIQVKKGYVEVPDKPGLGIELNEDALEKYTLILNT